MAEAKIVEAIVVNGVGEILKKLIPMATEEIGLLWNVKEELKKLVRTVTAIQALLIDAEKQQEKKETVRLFLTRLRDVAYAAEDVLDEFGYQTTRLRVSNKVSKCFFHSSISVAFKLKMAHKIQNINKKFDEIKRVMDSFNFVSLSIPTNLQNRKTTMPIETFSYVDESEVVGRDVDKSEIVTMLTGSVDNQAILSVLPIVGMGGLGKTTLAKLVYNDDLVVKYFDKRIWVHVSKDFDSKQILTNIIESVTNGTCQFSFTDVIQRNLKDQLSEKRFLLVLDDVWNEDTEQWDMLMSSLKIGARGSKIIATTRIVEVASMIGTLATYHLENLSEGSCWSILKNKAFGNGGAEETPNMVTIGKEIVKKCRGVPLAAKTLGGLMHIKKDEQEWLSIKNSGIWALPMDKDGILPALKLSYDHLPSPLKQCFLYCSIFPKGVHIFKYYLIRQWMALGFLQPSIGGRPLMEDIGKDYVNYLLCNSFFQDAENDDLGEIETFKMHDVVFDLAHSLSRFDNVHVGVEELKYNSNVLHLRLLGMDGDIKKIQEGLCTARKLRSLHLECMGTTGTSICSNVLDILFRKFKHLRVLDLSNCGIKELPSSIKKLKHLRYLDLSFNPIEALPASITSLYNLLTLNLKVCPLKELPQDMRKLVNLRHLLNFRNDGCSSQMPIEMGRLTCLNELSTFVVGQKRGKRIKELQRLDLGGILNIYSLENVRSRGEAVEANLMGKEKLVALYLSWGSRRVNWGGDHDSSSSSSMLMGNENKKTTIVDEDDHVLEGLRPHSNLKELAIANFGGENLPGWMISTGCDSFLPNLVRLFLENCERLERIPPLGRLPSLKLLHLKGVKRMKSLGSEFYQLLVYSLTTTTTTTTALFPSLEELSLEQLPSLEEWREPLAQQGSLLLSFHSFPRLERIFVHDCPKLVTMPSRFPSLKLLQIIRSNGILLSLVVEVPSLSRLEIVEVPELKFLPNGLLLHNNIQELHIEKCPNLEAIIRRPRPSEEEELEEGVQVQVILPSSSLELLQVNDCPSLTSLPDLRGLQHSIRKFYFLRNEKITRLPEGLHTLCTIEVLSIGGFSSDLESFPDLEPLQYLPSLRWLHIFGWSKLTSLPEQLQSLTQLQALGIHVFHSLTALPEWLGNLSSLRMLGLGECWKLTVDEYYDRQSRHILDTIVETLSKEIIPLCRRCSRAHILGFVTDPVQDVKDSCRTGAGTNVIFGLALGHKSVIIPIFAIAICIYVGFSFAAMYDIAVAALGMLGTTAIGLAIDAYGPISDNTRGIAEMAGMSDRI
ncbi:putative disease resistance protein RGA1 [Telopea speciosissima]|uniref:putative disease resistance protein RGA1 n=1 Tax=Telopea speciosissima TaxID=54955 RepID=UPI001CC5750A|nr:putative disease resistance protein RGA1 [Telopea speciosissima]